jgi:hypothetical protein
MPESDLRKSVPNTTVVQVQAVGLGHRFADGAWAFRAVNLSLRAGEIAILAGRN